MTTLLPVISAQSDEELAKLARALGHPHRIAILKFMLQHPDCICGDLVDVLPLAQSSVSQHLKKLRDAGWIIGEIEGPKTCYCLNRTAVDRFGMLLNQLMTTEKR
jgi:ArsR family transcriptional regulator